MRSETRPPEIIVSGTGCTSQYARSSTELVENIAAGRVVQYRPAIQDDRVLAATGLKFNPLHAGLPKQTIADAPGEVARRTKTKRKFADPRTALRAQVTLDVLADAGLTREDLSRPDFGVFWGTPGNQPAIQDYLAYAHANDGLDLWFTPSIRNLHCRSFRQDTLTADYADFFNLAAPVCTLFSACSSSLSSLLLAVRKISQGKIERALVLCFQEVTLFDILFLAGLNILSRKVGLPFCSSTDGISLGFGIGGVLVESATACERRSGRPLFRVRHITGSRGFSGSVTSPGMSVPFRAISQGIEAVLEESELTGADIDCIFPHGNGIRANDQAEAMALHKLFAEKSPPIANYTYQTGYLLSASGVFDLILAADVFQKNRVLPFYSPEPIEGDGKLKFLRHAGASPVPAFDASIQRLLKTCIGIDGSIVNCVLERV